MITIVKANLSDINLINEIFMENKAFLRKHHIPQWLNDYPSLSLIEEDINDNSLFFIKDNNEIIGQYVIKDYEETYDVIKGKWLDDTPYKVIHRLCIRDKYKGKGYALKIFDYLKNEYHHIRIDTHELNIPMNNCLIKAGFIYCGIITLKDNTLRNAYEYINQEV